jgi:hypothetical protein
MYGGNWQCIMRLCEAAVEEFPHGASWSAVLALCAGYNAPVVWCWGQPQQLVNASMCGAVVVEVHGGVHGEAEEAAPQRSLPAGEELRVRLNTCLKRQGSGKALIGLQCEVKQ